jgi:aminomethyltransferase
MTRATVHGVPVDISRTGYTGDLGYEIWAPWDRAAGVWDALMAAGRAHDLHPCGMLALDVARIEAGLLLIEVDFFSSKKAVIPSQRYSPYEMSLDRLVQLDKARFVGQRALRAERARGPSRRIVGLEVAWPEVEILCEQAGLPPTAPSIASRVAVPIYASGRQVGKATSTTWSPSLKKMIALATVAAEHATPGRRLELEYTVDAVRHRVGALVVKTPFLTPRRKTATPPG